MQPVLTTATAVTDGHRVGSSFLSAESTVIFLEMIGIKHGVIRRREGGSTVGDESGNSLRLLAVVVELMARVSAERAVRVCVSVSCGR